MGGIVMPDQKREAPRRADVPGIHIFKEAEIKTWIARHRRV